MGRVWRKMRLQGRIPQTFVEIEMAKKPTGSGNDRLPHPFSDLLAAAPVPPQAEFLVHESFPWTLISQIGVRSANIKALTERALVGAQHRPPVEIRPDWYY